MIRVDGFDKDGIPRVFGYGKTKALAETNARWACKEYLAETEWKAADKGTIDKWRFKVINSTQSKGA